MQCVYSLKDVKMKSRKKFTVIELCIIKLLYQHIQLHLN